MKTRSLSCRVLTSAALVTLVITFLLLFFYPTSSEILHVPFASSPSPQSPSTSSQSTNDRCNSLPNTNHIQVIVKTGANVIYDKLPTQLLTALSCCIEPLILSDYEQDLGPYHVYDVLERVNETIKSTHPDFSYYRTLQEYGKYGQDARKLRETSSTEAWNLDKYKFIHMLVRTWELRPGRDWYVFIEADTYLIWRNLIMWLGRLNPSHAYYLGSPTYLEGEGFAHGGSGIILSRAAMARVLDGDADIAARYDEHMTDEYYGDYVLMKALEEKGVFLQGSWPMMQGEKQNSLPFGPGSGVRHWCQPLVTMHRVTPGDVSAFWKFEQQRNRTMEPLLIADLYDYFMGRDLPSEREDWYNLSDDRIFRAPGAEGDGQEFPEEMTQAEREAYQSFEKCGKACEEHPNCFQYVYSYQEQACGFSFSYRLGERRLSSSDGKYKSGWVLEKIKEDQMENQCKKLEWVV